MAIDTFGEKEESKKETPPADFAETLGSQFDWRDQFRKDAISMMESWADDLGVSKFAIEAFIRNNIDGAINYISSRRTGTQAVFDETGAGRLQPKTQFSMQEYTRMWEDGLTWFMKQSGIDFEALSGSGRGRGSGTSSRAISPDDFDEDELTNAVTEMWRGYLVEEPKSARSIARQYINAVVSSGGQKDIDFKTFVQSKMEQTPRWSLLYQNKPEGVNPLEYISPYINAAQQVISGGGDRMSKIVGYGARLGANQEQFGQRLAKEKEVTGSSGFITGLEDRMRAVKGVLRG